MSKPTLTVDYPMNHPVADRMRRAWEKYYWRSNEEIAAGPSFDSFLRAEREAERTPLEQTLASIDAAPAPSARARIDEMLMSGSITKEEATRAYAGMAKPLPRSCTSADDLRPGMRVTTANSYGTHVVERTIDDSYPYLVYSSGPSAGCLSVGGAALAQEISEGRVTILAEAPEAKPTAIDDERFCDLCRTATPRGRLSIDRPDRAVCAKCEMDQAVPSAALPGATSRTCPRCSEVPCSYSCPAGGWQRYESEKRTEAAARAKREEEARGRASAEVARPLGNLETSTQAMCNMLGDELVKYTRECVREASAAAQRPFMHVVR